MKRDILFYFLPFIKVTWFSNWIIATQELSSNRICGLIDRLLVFWAVKFPDDHSHNFVGKGCGEKYSLFQCMDAKLENSAHAFQYISITTVSWNLSTAVSMIIVIVGYS